MMKKRYAAGIMVAGALVSPQTLKAEEATATPPAPPVAAEEIKAESFNVEEALSFLPEVVATYKGGEVTATEVKDKLGSQLKMMSQRGQLPSQENLKKMVEQFVNYMIEQDLLVKRAAEDGFTKDLEAAQQQLTMMEKQMGEEMFAQRLAQSGSSREEIADQIATQQLVNTLVTEKVLPTVEISDEAIAENYEQNKDKYTTDQEVSASHILIKLDQDVDEEAKEEAKKKIEGLLTELKDGADFAELAKANSDCPSSAKGGDLGTFGKGAMVPPFEQAAFALEDGEISDVVETQFGYHIIKRTGHSEAGQKSLDEVKGQISEEIRGTKGREVFQKMLDDMRENVDLKLFLANGAGE